MVNMFALQRMLTTVVLAFGLVSVAHAQEPTHYRRLDSAVKAALKDGRRVPVIVQFDGDEARERARQSVVRRAGAVKHAFKALRALSVEADPTVIDELARQPGVARVSLDATVTSTQVFETTTGVKTTSVTYDTTTTILSETTATSTTTSLLSGSTTVPVTLAAAGGIKAREKYGLTGSGITVAVIDSGVAPHPDLPTSRLRAFVDFVNQRTTPYDDYGHGTHVAGTLAGNGASGLITGVAPAASVVALKVLDGSGAGTTSNVIAALDWVLTNAAAYNIQLVNLSLGHPVLESTATDPLVQMVERVSRRGILVVVAAGNRGVNRATGLPGYGGVMAPGNAPSALTVGAIDTRGTKQRSDDTVTDYSSRGPTRFDSLVKPDLVAPGHGAVSLAAPGSYMYVTYPASRVLQDALGESVYFRLNGTSMATPLVTGAAALMLQANPGLSANTLRAALQFTAQKIRDSDSLTQGSGEVNIVGAVRLAQLINPKAPLHQWWLRTSSAPVARDDLNSEYAYWAKNFVWNQRKVYGDSAYVHLAAFDDSIVWSQNDNIVWSQDDNIVWGYSYDASDNIVWSACAQDDNIVWSQNIVSPPSDSTVWGLYDNIVWSLDDNIVWGMNIVWSQDDNIVWGMNLVWGMSDMFVVDSTPVLVVEGEVR